MNSIYYLFHALIEKYKEYKNVPQLKREDIILKEVKSEMLMSFCLLKGKNGKVKCNINKKLTHLIKISLKIVKGLYKERGDGVKEEEVVNKVAWLFLRKSPGSYLRMEEIEELFCCVYYG